MGAGAFPQMCVLLHDFNDTTKSAHAPISNGKVSLKRSCGIPDDSSEKLRNNKRHRVALTRQAVMKRKRDDTVQEQELARATSRMRITEQSLVKQPPLLPAQPEKLTDSKHSKTSEYQSGERPLTILKNEEKHSLSPDWWVTRALWSPAKVELPIVIKEKAWIGPGGAIMQLSKPTEAKPTAKPPSVIAAPWIKSGPFYSANNDPELELMEDEDGVLTLVTPGAARSKKQDANVFKTGMWWSDRPSQPSCMDVDVGITTTG